MPRILNYFLLTTSLIFFCRSFTHPQSTGVARVVHLSNDKIDFTLNIESKKLVSARLSITSSWIKTSGQSPLSFTADADFGMEIMWTDWQAPGKINNAENPVLLTKDDFSVERIESHTLEHGKKEVRLFLRGNDVPLDVHIVYELDDGKIYLRTRLEIIDTSNAGHFLQKVWPVREITGEHPRIIKEGGFGQPVAFLIGNGGIFFGMEYPAADNIASIEKSGTRVSCGQEVGEQITSWEYKSEWVVEGVTPDTLVKLWFMKYVDDIRVAPLKPYTLYNSWYDLRSPEYPKVTEGNVMNEKNILHIIDLMRKNMIEKHRITLDAFVLDDGWDQYQSDWVLRKNEFPHGLKSIADELRKTNTTLGLWFGPTGGYSFRMKRVNWMKDHGYEVVGRTQNTAMMCLAGKNYSNLFRKRTTNFVANDGVGYFKWDGIQFSCSEPDHGHPVGIYSRRAVMESLVDKCNAVRAINPNVFLNITSGTWLSPWWVKFANQIWMQGEDYGYADVPSVSPRDAAMTYRDLSLYEDFRKNDFWFPIQNLMTHGIIKGNLEKLGGEEEPLDKFTNEVLLYLARGVSMWELYISPDILTEGEWNALGEAMRWAKDRFPVLSTTEMIGGDPKKRESYDYVHFNGNRGIIAARNPWIAGDTIKVELSPVYGLERRASSLVFERVYPDRWISPQLYSAGSIVELPLRGYETVVYEIYPLSEAKRPLLAGAEFAVNKVSKNFCDITLYPTNGSLKLLSPDPSTSVSLDGKNVSITDLEEQIHHVPNDIPVTIDTFRAESKGFDFSFRFPESVRSAQLAILATPTIDSVQKVLPQIRLNVDGKEDTARFQAGEGASTWYTYLLLPGNHTGTAVLQTRGHSTSWTGKLSIWLIVQQGRKGVDVTLAMKDDVVEPVMPPLPFPTGITVRNVSVGEVNVLK